MNIQLMIIITCKQVKNKIKTSSLADYCDMVKEGVVLNPKHFDDKVV